MSTENTTSGTGIAGAMDYHPPEDVSDEPRCFVCGGPFKGDASYAARCLPPMVQVCSKPCFLDAKFNPEINHAPIS